MAKNIPEMMKDTQIQEAKQIQKRLREEKFTLGHCRAPNKRSSRTH